MVGGGLVVYNTKGGGVATGRWAGGLLPLELGEQTKVPKEPSGGQRTEGDRVRRWVCSLVPRRRRTRSCWRWVPGWSKSPELSSQASLALLKLNCAGAG